jgi:hypothetical protein
VIVLTEEPVFIPVQELFAVVLRTHTFLVFKGNFVNIHVSTDISYFKN